MNSEEELEVILRSTRFEPGWLGFRQSLWVALRAIFSNHSEVDAAVVFGSWARETHH